MLLDHELMDECYYKYTQGYLTERPVGGFFNSYVQKYCAMTETTIDIHKSAENAKSGQPPTLSFSLLDCQVKQVTVGSNDQIYLLFSLQSQINHR